MPIKDFSELESALAAFTSRLDTIDKIISASKLGIEMVPVFTCNHSGLHFPADYIKNWGRVYGIGLGPDPVSEVLDTDYYTNPPEITPDIRSLDQIMHPLVVCRVQVDFDLINSEETSFAIRAIDDPYMNARAKVVREKQLKNPLSKLKLMSVAWDRAGRN